jgi:vacuolar-type H+-ATPase subunit C/Vma6
MAALLQAARYSAANARVHALLSYLIPAELWAGLIDAPDLETVVSLLRDTWHGPALPAPSAAEPDVVQVERALAGHGVAAARLPLAQLQGDAYELLDWFWRRFELDNLKTVLRAVHHGSPPDPVRGALVALGPAATLPWADLAAVGSVPLLVERLAATWYGRVLRLALDQYSRQGSAFPLEVALDLAYYAGLLERIHRLGGASREDAVRFLGGWVDAQNLLWAFRFRLYAQLSPEEILNYTLQRRLRVDADVVRAIALGAPLLDVVRSVWRERLAGLDTLADVPELEALPRLELLFQRHFYGLAQRARLHFPLRLASVLAYEFLLDSELRDLVVVIEGKSFGWPGDRIRPYLIGERGL